MCEQILGALASYPRALPLGSHDAGAALLIANAVVSSFLDASVERRAQIQREQPKLLPTLGPQHRRRYLETSVTPPDAVGSAWVMSESACSALDDLRRTNLQVVWSSQEPPVLESQTPRLLATFCDVSASILRAGLAAFGGLHMADFDVIRKAVLSDLADADGKAVARP